MQQATTPLTGTHTTPHGEQRYRQCESCALVRTSRRRIGTGAREMQRMPVCSSRSSLTDCRGSTRVRFEERCASSAHEHKACAQLFFFSSRRRHTRFKCDWSSDVCSSDLGSKVLRQLEVNLFSPAPH